MSKFSQQVRNLSQLGYSVIEYTQYNHESMWQRVQSDINKCISNGHRRIAIVTNTNNPNAADIESNVGAMRVALPSTEIQFYKESL